jgi:hypothetical protein
VVARTTDGLRTGSAYAVLTPQQPLAQGIDVTLSGMGAWSSPCSTRPEPIVGQSWAWVTPVRG